MAEIKKAGHGWLMPLRIVTGLIVTAWLPVRTVFFDHLSTADTVFDVLIFAFVFGPYLLKAEHLPEHGKDKEEDHFIQRMAWVGVDLLVGLPFHTILAFAGYSLSDWWWLPKLVLIHHVIEIKKILEYYDNLHPVMQRILPIAFIMPTVVHLIACGWVWLGSGTAGPSGDAWTDYVKAVYWAFTTLTTVGYGDIAAKTLPQMGYCVFTQVVGVGFFGFVLSNVASLLARMDAARENHLVALDRVEAFMGHSELPHAIRVKVRSYYRYLWDTRHGYDDNAILSDLPSKLRSEVSLFLNAEIIEKVPLFKGAEPEMVEDIVLELVSKVVVPSEKVFHVGEPGDAMYFIHKGSMEIVAKEGNVLATLQPGSFFGEMALLTTNPRSATARASTYCDIFALSREAFEKVLARYPRFESQVREIAVQRGVKPPEPESKKAA